MVYYSEDYLCHYGIKGQKWGVRRFQKPNGTLTEAGKVRYSTNRQTSSTGAPHTDYITGDKDKEVKRAEHEMIYELERELKKIQDVLIYSNNIQGDHFDFSKGYFALDEMESLYETFKKKYGADSVSAEELIKKGYKKLDAAQRNLNTTADTNYMNKQIKESSSWKTGAKDIINTVKNVGDNWKVGAKDINKAVKKTATSTAAKATTSAMKTVVKAKSLGDEFVDNWTTGVKDIFGSKKKKKKSK